MARDIREVEDIDYWGGHEPEPAGDWDSNARWSTRLNWVAGGTFGGRGPVGRADERIREDVCDGLARLAVIDASAIDVQVHEGEVTLSGAIEDGRMKRMAEDVVRSVSGVRQVHNRLSTAHWRPEPPFPTLSGRSPH
jgi:hypothetical protein